MTWRPDQIVGYADRFAAPGTEPGLRMCASCCRLIPMGWWWAISSSELEGPNSSLASLGKAQERRTGFGEARGNLPAVRGLHRATRRVAHIPLSPSAARAAKPSRRGPLCLCGRERTRHATGNGHQGSRQAKIRGSRKACRHRREVLLRGGRGRRSFVDQFAGREFNYVITGCDNAKQTCPAFPGRPEWLHWRFEDPAAAEGPDEHRRAAFRNVRDEIRGRIERFLSERTRIVNLSPAEPYL
jgi:hypothetical protein